MILIITDNWNGNFIQIGENLNDHKDHAFYLFKMNKYDP